VPLAAVPDFLARAEPALAAIGAFPHQLLRPSGRRQPALQRLSRAGPQPADHDHQRDAIKTGVHDLVHELGGSVSAEHGIGRLKVADLERYGDPVALAAMRAIKAALDPAGILNPGAVLRRAGY
jgi:FAD/FMN-containing dehydrogenase